MARLCDPLDRLTPRRLHIVELACDGYTDAQIARILRISPHTLRWHTTQIRHILPSFRFPNPPSPPRRPLTRREQEIAALVAEGLDNVAISALLGITFQCVAQHVSALYAKTQTENRVDLALTVLIVQNRIPIGASEAA